MSGCLKTLLVLFLGIVALIIVFFIWGLFKVKDKVEDIAKEAEARERIEAKFHASEDFAMELIKDNYEFYERDISYKDVKIRRIDNNEFEISVLECICSPSSCKDDYCWDSVVKKLIVAPDSTYSYKTKYY